MIKKSAGKHPSKTGRTPPTLTPQAHGGALLSGGRLKAEGGKAGPGRTPADYAARCAKLVRSPRMWRRLREVMRKGDHRALLQLQKQLADRAYGSPTQSVEVKQTLAALLESDGETAV
jgi:hypothetical protein